MDGLLFEIGSSIKIRDRRIFQIPFQSKYIDSEVFWINFKQLFLLILVRLRIDKSSSTSQRLIGRCFF